ncbi:hypothetical protein Bbelb_223950 [Branchiostoma belcheri]|nr:hypothetical protein Bbelb_223950 [Branchiostoma belcheri]
MLYVVKNQPVGFYFGTLIQREDFIDTRQLCDKWLITPDTVVPHVTGVISPLPVPVTPGNAQCDSGPYDSMTALDSPSVAADTTHPDIRIRRREQEMATHPGTRIRRLEQEMTTASLLPLRIQLILDDCERVLNRGKADGKRERLDIGGATPYLLLAAPLQIRPKPPNAPPAPGKLPAACRVNRVSCNLRT